MHISLSPETEEFVQSQIKSGIYHDASEMMDAVLKEKIEFCREINQKIQEGLDDSKNGRVMDGREAYAKIKAAIMKRD